MSRVSGSTPPRTVLHLENFSSSPVWSLRWSMDTYVVVCLMSHEEDEIITCTDHEEIITHVIHHKYCQKVEWQYCHTCWRETSQPLPRLQEEVRFWIAEKAGDLAGTDRLWTLHRIRWELAEMWIASCTSIVDWTWLTWVDKIFSHLSSSKLGGHMQSTQTRHNQIIIL